MISIIKPNTGGFHYIIRPTPFISITGSPVRKKTGRLGSTYQIVLTGTIIADEGSPFSTTNFHTNFNRPPSEFISEFTPTDRNRLTSILNKQNALRDLVSTEGIRIEVSSVNTPPIVFYPKLESINFEEGTYFDTCRYTVTFSAYSLLNDVNLLWQDSRYAPNNIVDGPITELAMRGIYGGLVEDFSENWSIEVDEGVGETRNDLGAHNPRTYRITRTLSAVGRDGVIPGVNGSVEILYPWLEARNFIYTSLIGGANQQNGGINAYPNKGIAPELGLLPNTNAGSSNPPLTYSGFGNASAIIAPFILNLNGLYNGCNHTRTEGISQTDGSYNITDTWLLASGHAYENFQISLNTSTDSAISNVSINGTIKGLSNASASGILYVGSSLLAEPSGYTPLQWARDKFYEVSNNASFGLNCHIYKRALNTLKAYNGNLSYINPNPRSITISENDFVGEIQYSLEYDNRPENLISGVKSESININDTYPGDVYAIVPVLGRQTGPVLQYIGSRTEYRRDVGIELVLDSSGIPHGSGRNPLLLAKPSIREPYRSQLNNLIQALSPKYEPGIRKYFLDPPQETWIPKEGRYSLNLSWVYELDH